MSNSIELDNIGNILSNIGNKLIKNQELLKCIAVDSSDALSSSDIQPSEIINLIGKGSDPKSQQRIFKVFTNNNIIEETRTELRFGILDMEPNNIYISQLSITFQIIIYNTLWELDENKFRPFVMIKNILKELNGYEEAGGIGELQLNQSIKYISYNDNFSGYMFPLSTRTV